MAQEHKTAEHGTPKPVFQKVWAWLEARSLPTAHAMDPMMGWAGCVDSLALAHTRYVAIPVKVQADTHR